ncbi:MAG: hypothetical protein JJU27_16035 [Gammaproteobacteria bacterium]|nr:hypothetical protein [Gammaproteobacteria bacterium]
MTHWWEGSYEYRHAADGEPFGVERFRLMRHPDGTRTILVWNDNRARATQISMLLRVDAAFRPVTAFAAYWSGGLWRGTVNIDSTVDLIRLASAGPGGEGTLEIAAPESFSLSMHPVSADGLHLAAMPKGALSAQLFAMDPAGAEGISASLVTMPIERHALTTVEVPAGRFDALHATLAGANEMWVTPEDFIVLRMRLPRLNAEYVLTCLISGTGLASDQGASCAGGAR